MSVLVISCSLNPDSRSRTMAQAARACLERLGAAPRYIDLRDLSLPPCDGDQSNRAPAAVELAQAIRSARAVILATPIYNFSVSAAAKNLVELTGKAWTHKTVGFLCAAGGQGSYMAVMGLANSLMLDFRCLIVPRFVYATGQAFDHDALASPEVARRIEELCQTTLTLAGALPLPT